MSTRTLGRKRAGASVAAGGRYTAADMEAWRRDGGVSIHNFFTREEVAAVVADFDMLFDGKTGADEAMDKKKEGQVGRFHGAQFEGIASVPIDCSPALNLIGVHPALIRFAKEALRTDKVHVYQCQAWAKYTGDADYDQPFHTDFSNHTLVAPSEDERLNAVTILCYFSDVTEAHGPMHYVTRGDSLKVAGPEASLARDPDEHVRLQNGLRAYERSSAAPAGSAFPYAIDVYHRGTNLTAPNGRRYALMTCFKAAGNESIGFRAWAFHHTMPWARIFDHATPEQLECFGVHPPGHAYWTELTLARAQARYPNWDLTPYREAMATAATT